MRIACLSLLAVAASSFLVARPDRPADDKKEEERWEKEEKELAELEPGLEKEDWAVQQKQLISELVKELQRAERVEVFRLDPKPLPEKGKDAPNAFHGHAILSEAQAESAERRKEVASFLGKTLHWDNRLRVALCFDPRHGVRAVRGDKTLDLVICFQCSQVYVYEDDNVHHTFVLVHPKDNPLEQLLHDAEAKAKKRP